MNYLSGMLDDDTKDRRYHPRQLVEMMEDEVPVSLINEPIREVIELRPGQKHSLHAVLCDALTSSRGLLQRLEAGVTVPPGEGREAVRDLYVQMRRTVQALSRCLELPLE